MCLEIYMKLPQRWARHLPSGSTVDGRDGKVMLTSYSKRDMSDSWAIQEKRGVVKSESPVDFHLRYKTRTLTILENLQEVLSSNNTSRNNIKETHFLYYEFNLMKKKKKKRGNRWVTPKLPYLNLFFPLEIEWCKPSVIPCFDLPIDELGTKLFDILGK